MDMGSDYMPILTYGAETRTWTRADINRLMAAEMRFLRSKAEWIKRKRIRNKTNKQTKKIKINTMEGKLTNNRIRWYGHVLRMNEETTQPVMISCLQWYHYRLWNN
jgi:hypothetical protein